MARQKLLVRGGEGNRSGYMTHGDILTHTIDGVDLNELWGEFIDANSVYNQHKQGMVGLLTYPVVSDIELVPQIGDFNFEEATEFGIPRKANTNISYYQLAYSYKDWDLGVGYTWKFLRDAPAAQVEAIHAKAIQADQALVFRKVMEALFDNRSRQTIINAMTYNVYPLANGDGWVPPSYKGQTFDGSHNHYLKTNKAVLDPGDFENAVNHLTEHGYGWDTGTQIVLFANRAQVNEIRKWRLGVASQGVTANFDFVPAMGQPALIVPNAEGLLGGQAPATWNGLRVSGSYMDVLVIEEPLMPAGYLLFLSTGGPNVDENIVGIREHASPEWRGMRLLPGNQQRYPLVDGYYIHGFGTGIRRRTGAVIVQVGTGTTYAPPTDYTADSTKTR
ncbi:major capsid protein [Mycobacterium phage Leopard]|uniref:Major capsid protein n=1 Tax=Mycobacterium phage Onyinye TaxID=2686235 RepID=A0A6B9LHX1_9CAUD|nr:major head protein [Mycobacterium phage Onyinye]QHB37434.1 major capsid protein [Mycobacterium phage Onyinye]UOW92905.1 major capsid protein [Mycobacterium phage Leopard]